jgi:hypothetical protein
MKTVDQVGKVLSVIFNKILDIGKKIIDWLGFVFNWKDITATKDSIVNIVKDALEPCPLDQQFSWPIDRLSLLSGPELWLHSR